MDKNDYKAMVSDQMTRCTMYEEALLLAVSVMENAAKNTTDQETFKELHVGFVKVKEVLGITKEETDG